MTRQDVQNIAELLYTRVNTLEQNITVTRGPNQINAHLLTYTCDVIESFFHEVLSRRFPTLTMQQWQHACLRGGAVFPKKE